MKQIIISMLIVTALGAASGGLYAFRFVTVDAVQDHDKAAEAEKKPGPAVVAANSRLLDLPAIVTNLGSPQETWIRLEASLLLQPKAPPQPEALAAQVANDILAFLRSTSLSQIQGPAGLQSLRDDLNERVALRTNGVAKELVIRTLVVQ